MNRRMAMRSVVFKACAVMSFIALGACSKGSPGGDAFNGGDPGQPETGTAGESGIITALSVSREDGKAVDQFMTHHPLQVKMSLRPTAPVANHVIHVGLVEKAAKGTARGDLRTCFLGAFEATYGVEEGQAAQ